MDGPRAAVDAADDPMNNFVRVLCCVCGIPIAPNSANTCASCLASSSDITHGISTEVTLHQCRSCQRWHKEAGKWMSCGLESRELMALCLANVSGMKATKGNTHRTRLIDAAWIWTEPHSMRLKVRLTIQKEVQKGTILQQSFTVVFVVRNQQCLECQAEFRQGSWKSLVQVRQRVSHKRTFLYLEQSILKHGGRHENSLFLFSTVAVLQFTFILTECSTSILLLFYFPLPSRYSPSWFPQHRNLSGWYGFLFSRQRQSRTIYFFSREFGSDESKYDKRE